MASGRRSVGPGGLSVDSVLMFVGLGLFVVLVGGTWSSLKLAAVVHRADPAGGPTPLAAAASLAGPIPLAAPASLAAPIRPAGPVRSWGTPSAR